MKVPRVTWLPRSRMKFSSSRGPNWFEANVNATMVIEKTTPATVIIDAAIAPSTSRAPSGPPEYTTVCSPGTCRTSALVR